MKEGNAALRISVFAVTVLAITFASVIAEEQESAQQAGEQVAVEGTFVRVAANDEGWVVVSYDIANDSVGDEWMLLHVGMTARGDEKSQTIYRTDVALVTPDGEVIRLPSQNDFEKARGEVAPLVQRAAMVSDSIDYFPPSADRPCRIGFFSDPGSAGPQMAYDQVDLTNRSACVGYLYFPVPGGIKLGTYNLDVQFEGGVVRVPLQMMTKDQAKQFEKEWKAASKKK